MSEPCPTRRRSLSLSSSLVGCTTGVQHRNNPQLRSKLVWINGNPMIAGSIYQGRYITLTCLLIMLLKISNLFTRLGLALLLKSILATGSVTEWDFDSCEYYHVLLFLLKFLNCLCKMMKCVFSNTR